MLTKKGSSNQGQRPGFRTAGQKPVSTQQVRTSSGRTPSLWWLYVVYGIAVAGVMGFVGHEVLKDVEERGRASVATVEPTSESTAVAPAPEAEVMNAVVDVEAPAISREQVEALLAETDANSLAEVERSLAIIQQAFATARDGVPEFVDDALGWASTFSYIGEQFQQDARHQRYLQEKFAEFVMSDEEMNGAVHQAVAVLNQAIEGHESELLLRLRADVPGFEELALNLPWNSEQVSQRINTVISEVRMATGTALGVGIAREILAEIGTQVAMRALVASSTISNDEDRTWGGFLLEVGVGMALSEVASQAYDHYQDPDGKLVASIQSSLLSAERQVIDGSTDEVGLQELFVTIVQARNQARNAAVLKLLNLEVEETHEEE